MDDLPDEVEEQIADEDVSTDIDYLHTGEYMTPVWQSKARETVEERGLESTGVLVLQLAEQLGEIADEVMMNMDLDEDDAVNQYSARERLAEIQNTAAFIGTFLDDEDVSIETKATPELINSVVEMASLTYQLQAAIDRSNLED